MALTDTIEIPRRTMVLFFIVDTSGSMEGAKIGAVNTAIREVIPEIRDISNENADALIKIAALEFSSGATWITKNGPVEADNFNWNNIDAAGVTDFGAACKALNDKLSTKAFMSEATGSFAPALFLLSDGEPTDDWKKGLDVLKQNNWFKAAVKVAIAIGDSADQDVLAAFTGTKETVLTVHTTAALVKMIKFVSVRASQVASTNAKADPTQGSPDQAKTDELIANLSEIQEEMAAAPDNSGGDDW
ncbi:MAG: VWA domain-containing protein [Treponema sp.]|nr:VWA domain-containing protein [Treponema sp.]MCL2250736.1 VWA domain-containing protein [Treponema sp.]